MASPQFSIPLAQGLALPPLSRFVLWVAIALATWDLRRKTRADLARLPAHLLKDLGLCPMSAQTECAKRFWQA